MEGRIFRTPVHKFIITPKILIEVMQRHVFRAPVHKFIITPKILMSRFLSGEFAIAS
jgi:hypothetical protein